MSTIENVTDYVLKCNILNMPKVYTKKGDKGMTQLGSGIHVPKFHPRIEAVGAIDELNSLIGVIGESESICRIQNNLFCIGSYIANPARKELLDQVDAKHLEEDIDKMTEEMPELSNFILPNGNPLAARYHVARSTARRAERRIAFLASQSKIDPRVQQYINRISDYFFTCARYANFKAGIKDHLWEK